MSMRLGEKEDFIVDRDKVRCIEHYKNKIQRIYGVKIHFDNAVKIDGESEKQWLSVKGGKWDRQNAKAYIIGLCNPEEKTKIKSVSSILDNEVLENIEKNTNAVILQPKEHELEISGTQLAVTLALSAVEELTAVRNDIVIDGDDGVCSHSTAHHRDSLASERLAVTLERALSHMSDRSGSMEDYKSAPDSVKRVILDCLSHDDVDDNELFAEGRTLAAKSAIDCQKVQHSEAHRNSEDASYSIPIQYTTAVGLQPGQAIMVHEDTAPSQTHIGSSCIVKSVAKALTEAKLSQQSEFKKEENQQLDSEHDYLRALGLSVGYTQEDTEVGLLYVKSSTRPAEYLQILQKIKEQREQLEIPDVVSNGNSAAGETVADCAMDRDENCVIIIDDSFQEDEEKISQKRGNKCQSVGMTDDEKEKNQNKQRELKEMFEQQQKNKGRKSKDSINDIKEKYEGKEVEKKKQPPVSYIGPVLGIKRKQDQDSDQDQTCVMKVWQSGRELSGPSASGISRVQRIVSELPVPLEPPQACRQSKVQGDLRYIVIDGSNVAFEHGNSKVFSCRGIEICANYFLSRGHKITIFVPEWRKYRIQRGPSVTNQEILEKLRDRGHLVFTPSRKIQGKLIASYDDRYVVSLAEKEDGVIISNDQYRDLMSEKASWKKIIEERLLMFRFVGDHFMPPEDPLGRDGPTLNEFLRKSNPALPPPRPANPPPCNWQRNEAYNPNWQPPQRFPLVYHHDRPLVQSRGRQPPVKHHKSTAVPARHVSVTEDLLKQLKTVFPESGQEEKIRSVLANHSTETDMNRLTNYCMNALFQ